MPLIARDSTDPQAIPLSGLSAVMGYADGIFQWTSADWALFQPPIVPLSIVVSAADAGDILDVETGDAIVAECPGWADRFNRPGRRLPTIYHSRSVRSAVLTAMAWRPYDWWAATLDGTLDGTDGAVAVQWKGSAQTGGDYDETVILDPAWIGRQSGGDMLTQDDITAVAAAVQAQLFGPSGTATYLTDITQEVVNGAPVGPNGVATQLPAILAAVKAIQVPTAPSAALAALNDAEVAIQAARKALGG